MGVDPEPNRGSVVVAGVGRVELELESRVLAASPASWRHGDVHPGQEVARRVDARGENAWVAVVLHGVTGARSARRERAEVARCGGRPDHERYHGCDGEF